MRTTWMLAGLVAAGGAVWWWSPSCAAPEVVVGAPRVEGHFDGPDTARPHLQVALEPVASGIAQPTDIQAVPGQPGLLAVLDKEGEARLLDLKAGRLTDWLKVAVNARSEMGLLGVAFHPKYAENGRFFLSYNPAGVQQTRLAEWQGPSDPRTGAPHEVRVLLEVEQPWANHDGGQVQFGPDGLLYFGLGDGGAADDPKGNGQNRNTLLGKMLRIGVEPEGGRPYTIPADNPWVGQAGARPEVWAWGLRNPWRFSFGPDGRLWVGDVGQNLWEEITVVGRGENHGWNRREANQCFPPGTACTAVGLVDPVHVYGRDAGASVTGGYVYQGDQVPELKGKYVFGDFASGRLWALNPAQPDQVWALGTFPIYPATFGVGHDGALYVGDFREGRILRVVATKTGR